MKRPRSSAQAKARAFVCVRCNRPATHNAGRKLCRPCYQTCWFYKKVLKRKAPAFTGGR